MKKSYRLIKSYPGGPKTMGLIIYENGPFYESHFHIENTEHFHSSKDMVENFPEFWEEIFELEVPVGTLFMVNVDETCMMDSINNTYKLDSINNDSVTITWKFKGGGSTSYNSSFVSRQFKAGYWVPFKDYLSFDELVDGQIYKTSFPEQGDYIFKSGYDLWVNTKHKSIQHTSHTSLGLNPENGFEKFYIATEEEAMLLVKKIKFISEDNLPLYVGDIMYRVSLVSNDYSLSEIKVREELPEPASYFKDFSTKEKAQEYIDLHKPKYSMQDILEASSNLSPFLETRTLHMDKLNKVK